MTLIQLLIYAALSSQAQGDSARMAAQMPPDMMDIVSAGQERAPVDIYETARKLIPCDADNCGKVPTCN